MEKNLVEYIGQKQPFQLQKMPFGRKKRALEKRLT
jgi:hypothetical protein